MPVHTVYPRVGSETYTLHDGVQVFFHVVITVVVHVQYGTADIARERPSTLAGRAHALQRGVHAFRVLAQTRNTVWFGIHYT